MNEGFYRSLDRFVMQEGLKQRFLIKSTVIQALEKPSELTCAYFGLTGATSSVPKFLWTYLFD